MGDSKITLPNVAFLSSFALLGASAGASGKIAIANQKINMGSIMIASGLYVDKANSVNLNSQGTYS